MADNRQDLELLFFETFSHDNAEELNLDLVQFPRPVLIGEVRVIPLQTRVQVNVPGGVRLGATNPSNFKLELFVNNLSKPNASTFEKLGVLDYKANEDIQMLAEVQIPTDGLILKGWYNTLTVAIYGVLTSVTVEPEALPPPPPPQPRKQAVAVQPGAPPSTAPAPAVPKPEAKEWEHPPQPVVGTPHTTQHPLDYIQEQLQQANLQAPPMTVTVGHQPHPAVLIPPQGVPNPGQIAMGVPPGMQEYPRQDDYGRHPADTDRFSPDALGPGGSKEHYESREPYDDNRSRESWAGYHDKDRRHGDARDGRDFPTSSREGSLDRNRERDYRERADSYRDRDDRDWDRDKRDRDRGSRDRPDYDRDSKDRGNRGRGYDDRRDRDYDQDMERNYDREREADAHRDRESMNRDSRDGINRDSRDGINRDSRDGINRDSRDGVNRDSRDRDPMNRERRGEYGRDGYRDTERGRDREGHPDRDMDRSREWEGDRSRGEHDPDNRGHDAGGREIGRDVREQRDRGFRDRTREDYREKERAREVYMETEAPRSPSRSRSFSGDRFSSKSRSPSPARPLSREITPSRSHGQMKSPGLEGFHVKDSIPEQPTSPSPDLEQNKPAPQVQATPAPPVVTEEPVAEVAPPVDQMSPDHDGSLIEQIGYMSDGDYEAISSEDELIDIDTDMRYGFRLTPRRRHGSGIDYDMDEEAFSYITAPFNPYQFEMFPPVSYDDVSLTKFEQEKQKLLQAGYKKPDKRPKEAQQLLDIVARFKTENHFESWVEAMESVPSLLSRGLSYLLYVELNQDILPTLIAWMLESLDESQAMAQPESAYKVRHLKMGFKLAGALCSCDSGIAIQCLRNDVQDKLLDVFQSRFMSFSLKLQIVAALDHTTRLKDGIQWFLGKHKLQLINQEPATESTLSNYQRAVRLMLQKQVVRVIVAMTTLIKKVHLYEVMSKLGLQVESVVERLPASVSVDEGLGLDDADIQISEAEIENLTICLEEITKVYTLAPTLIAQPPRTLPGVKMVEIKPSSEDPFPLFYHLASSSDLLESLLVLVSCPVTSGVPTLFGAARALLQKMMTHLHGLLYLATRSEVTNKIIQALTQIADYNREEVSDENAAQQLGVELIYFLQAVLLVDKLREYHKSPDHNMVEDQQPISMLHMLHTMTFTPLGHTAVVQVLTYDDNITVLTPFVTLSGKDREDAKLRKCVCAGYTTELLNIIIHYSENVHFLRKHGLQLLKLGEQEFSSKLSRLKEWLAPLKVLTSINHEGLPDIIEQLKAGIGDIVKLPRGLITVLRILRHLSIAPNNDYPEDKNEEMKYKYAIVEMYSADCLPIFMSILQKLSELMLRPWQQGIPRSSEAISLYLYIIKPCLEMVRTMTQYLIMARGTEYRDVSMLTPLFELHTVLCSVPVTNVFSMEINAIQKDVVDTIAAYTQPMTQPNDEKDKISQSLWTLTIRDLLKFTMKAPYTYLSGLQMLSELLPLPLPLQTREPLSRDEEQMAVNTRKLWSAHLLPLHTALHNIIRTLSVTSCHPLQQILRKICWQMSDLAAPTATMITQCILDILIEHIELVEKTAANPEEWKIALATRGRFLNLLAYLISQPAIKCAMLRIMGPGGEEKYQGVLQKMLEILNQLSDRPDHVQDQESIVSILQSLCDMEVTLTSGETPLTIPEQVSNALPASSQLTLIIEALLEHIAHPSHKYDSVLPCIRSLVMLTEHDYSFYLLKNTFEKHKLALYRLLQRIKFKFSKDSSDCLSTFSTTLEFLRLLVDVDIPLTRTITLTNQELREVVAWTQDVMSHPLVDLQKLLEESLKEEETLDSLVDSVNSLLSVLRKDSPIKNTGVTAPLLPEAQVLAALFNMRSVCTVTDPDDDRLSATFWQTTFEADEPDLVSCDLEGMCIKYCREFNLEEELKKDTGLASEEELTKPKKLKDRRKSQEYVSWRGRGIRRPFVAPMRGRGIARGLAAQANRHDNFRNRPPNTSRPPSMHVDDFMKLEQKSEQNRDGPSDDQVRRDNEFAHRGRGFDRGGGRGGGGFDRGRGRFFTPPGSFRRDVGAAGIRDGDNSIYNRSKPPFANTRFGGGNSHDRGMSSDRRDSRMGGRFEPRGRGTWRGANWGGPSRFKDNERFGSGTGNMTFRGRNDANRNHQRSFTK